MEAPRPSSSMRNRSAGWLAGGVLSASVLIGGSVAALHHQVLGHGDWDRGREPRGGVVMLGPGGAGANQPGGSGRGEGGAMTRARLQRETGGTLAPSAPRTTPQAPSGGEAIRVGAGGRAERPAVARTYPCDGDGDGLTDAQEAEIGTDPAVPDTDLDGLLDGTEVELGTSPFAADTDGDGVVDIDEGNVYGTDPFSPDSDGDGLSDGDEAFTYGTTPTSFDTDGDGADDGTEINAGTNPFDPASLP